MTHSPLMHISTPSQTAHEAPLRPQAELLMPPLHAPPTPPVQHPPHVTGHIPPQPSAPPHPLVQVGMQTHW
jgi:hypothetical protein